MGIRAPGSSFERDSLERAGIDFPGLAWCELGNQRIRRKPAKLTYLERGVSEHVCIDLNGRDGALALDLDEPVPAELRQRFDVVTNYGTSEHVNNQYQVFRNIHELCRDGGLMIHIVPRTGHWPEHCRYYYGDDFPAALANMCSYDCVLQRLLDFDHYQAPRNLLAFTYQKTAVGFPDESVFSGIDGLEDSGDLRKTGDYNARRLKYRLRARLDRWRGKRD